MATRKADRSYQVIWLTRRLFRALAQEAEHYLQPFGVSAPERAVLEFLDGVGPAPVPAIARQHDVSRQHIQANVNTLLDKGLVETRPNPEHRRSQLVQSTAQGRKTFDEIRRHETKRMAALFAGLQATDLDATCRTLEGLLKNLRDRRAS